MKQTMLFIYIFAFFLAVNSTCLDGEIEATITKINGPYCREDSLSIYLGNEATTIPIFTRGWTDDDINKTTIDILCINPAATYTALFTDSRGEGWELGDTLSITVDGDAVLNPVRIIIGSTSHYLISYGSIIKYTNIPQIGNDWTSESFSDSTWTGYTTSHFPSVSSITRYYRATSNVEYDNLWYLYVSLKAKDGYILYANGIEQYRYGLPTISDANTLATVTGTSYVERIIAIRTDTFLTGTKIIIAVELHGVSDVDTFEDGFDLFVKGYTAGSGAIDHTYIPPINTQCIPDGTSFSNSCSIAFDNSLYSYLYVNGHTGVDIILYNGAVKLNGYEITCSGTTKCPKDWNLYGTIDSGATWLYLDFQTDQTFTESIPTHNYFIRSNTLIMNGLKLEITANNGASATQLNELRPLLVNYPDLSPGIHYENEITTFNGKTFVDMSITPISSGLTNFSITPDLPMGLTLDSKTGNISGIPTVGTNQEYTISANIGISTSISALNITLIINDCSQPTMANLKFVKYDRYGAENEKFIVKDQNGVVILNESGYYYYDKYYTYIQCHDAGIYEITLISETNNGWDTGSYLDVFLINENVNTEYRIERFYLLEGSTSTFKFNTKLDIVPKSTWKYLDSDTINSEWFYAVFDDSVWTTMDYVTLPQVTHQVVLFRKTITDITRNDYKGIELQMYSRDGIVVYANEAEVYRINLTEGDITVDTTATATSDYVWRKVTLPISVIGTTDTSLTLAIVQVSTQTIPYTLQFDCTLRLIPSNDIIQTYDGIQSSDDYWYNNLFDMNIASSYQSSMHDGQTEHWTQILFSNQGAIFANKYCIVTSYNSQYDISDWKIYGTTDGTTWNQLSTETNISWNSPYQRRCFYIPNLTKPQLGYRFAPTKNVAISFYNYYTAAEMEFYFEDIVIPSLTMTPSYIIAYKGASVLVLTPNSDYYHDFTISPSLPSPLLLDSSNGSIKNIPSSLQDATEYTITATDIQGHTSSTTITLTVTGCSSPNTILTLQTEFKDYSQYAGYASWIIRTPSNKILDSKRYSHDNAIETFSYCVIAGTYTFIFSTTNNTWGNGKFYIQNGSETTLYSGTVATDESPKKVTVTIGKLLEDGNNNWKYLQEDTQPLSSWTTASFSDASWGTALSSLIPVPSSTTQYYRTTFVLDSIDLSNIAGFEFGASSYAGLIFYMNGQEIMRFNMPSGDVNVNTLATKGTDSYIYYKSSFPKSNNYVIVGTNIVAIEIHKFNVIPSTNTFDAYIQFISKDSYRIMDGIPSSDIETTSSEGYANVFDGIKYTYTYSGPRCVGGYYTWTYNNGRKEFINKLSVTNSNSGCYNRNPSGWILEGSNDNGETWNILFGTHDQSFTTPSQTIENTFYSNNSYNSYRYTTTECNNVDSNSCSSGLELSEISLYADTISISCQADDVWNPAPEGGYSYQSCSYGYSGYKKRACTNGVLREEEDLCVMMKPTITYSQTTLTGFTNQLFPIINVSTTGLFDTISIEPELPSGLLLDCNNGHIYGTPTIAYETTQYIVTIENTSGKNTVVLTITIEQLKCPQDNEWEVTNADEIVSHSCSGSLVGSITRQCSSNGEWEEPIHNCVGCFGVYYKSGNECIVCDHGIVSGDAEGNTNCDLCDFTTHYIQNNECISKNICEAGIYDSIIWHDTLSGYNDIVDCESDTTIGFYSRQCDFNSYTSGWSDIVDKSSCKSKSNIPGSSLVYVQLSINNLASYQYNSEINLYVTRAFIVENQYSLYDIYLSIVNSYSPKSYMENTIYIFLYTSTAMSSNILSQNERNMDHLLKTLHKYNSKLFNNYLSVDVPTIIVFDNVLTCFDPTSETQIPIGSTTPNQCDKDIDGYMEYKCIQYHLETKVRTNRFIKCHPLEPSIIPTVLPSTIPTETPTSTPIDQYIKFELLLVGTEVKNIYCSTKVGLYRAILVSTHSIFYYFDITHYENVNYNGGIALKVYILFRSDVDLLYSTVLDLQLSLHQSEMFSSNLIRYAKLYINNIQALINEVVDPKTQNMRRLRG